MTPEQAKAGLRWPLIELVVDLCTNYSIVPGQLTATSWHIWTSLYVNCRQTRISHSRHIFKYFHHFVEDSPTDIITLCREVGQYLALVNNYATYMWG